VLVYAEAKGADKVHRRAHRRAEAPHVPGVRWNLGLDEDHVQRTRAGLGAQARGRGRGARHAEKASHTLAGKDTGLTLAARKP
jgi:hypothetical protein